VKGLDTDVLVRYVTADDPEQAEVARAKIEGAESRGERLFVSGIVLCELVWALRGGAYGYEKSEVVEALEGLLHTSIFEVQQRNLVRKALSRYRDGRADFADWLLGLIHQDAGCSETWTFDTCLEKARGFALLGP
jgi:predicted nucleic-acid-binding protein